MESSQIAAAVRLTFEEMAFLDVEPGPPATAEPVEEGPSLFLAYMLPKPGSFVLILPKAVKFAVAEAIYGEEWTALSSAQLDDSLLELMNVLAGRLLSVRFENAATSMGLPSVLYEPPRLDGYRREDYSFHVDSHEFTLTWYEAAP